MTDRKPTPEGAPIPYHEAISYGIEALVRKVTPPFGTERTDARTRVSAEICSQLLAGADPQMIVNAIVSAIERVEQTATVR
jgi:hypothetical protein